MTNNKILIKVIDGRSTPLKKAKGIAMCIFLASILFGPGVIVNSAAMQWAGFILLFVLVIACIAQWQATYVSSFDEARKMIDKLEAEE